MRSGTKPYLLRESGPKDDGWSLMSTLSKSKSLNFSMMFILIGTAVFFIPLMFSNSTIDPVLIPRYLAFGVMLFVLICIIWIQSKQDRYSVDLSLPRRMIFLAFTCYLLFSSLSLIIALNLGEAIFELSKIFLSLCFLFIATVVISRNANGRDILAKSIAIIAIFLSMIGIIQYFQIPFYSFPGNSESIVYSTMANRNLHSSAMFLLFPFAFYGVLHFPGFWRIISILSTILIWYNIIITETRAVWVAVVVGAVSIVLLLAFLKRKRMLNGIASSYSKRLLQATVILILVTLVSVSISKYYYPDFSPVERLASITNLQHRSVSERLVVWQKTIQMIKDNPIFGVGLGNWKIMLPHYGTTAMRSESGIVHFQRPHNDYLWVFSETGILGFVFYLSVFVIVLGYAIKIILYSSNDHNRIFSTLTLFGLVGYLVISFFSFPKERVVHSILLIFMISGVLSIYHKTFPIPKRLVSSRISLFAIPLLIMLSLSIAIGYTRVMSEIHTKRALAAREAGNWELVISEIDKAESWFSNMEPMSTPLPWYRGLANFSLNNVEVAFKDFQRAYEIHPYHIHVLNNLATCYELLGHHLSAIGYYNEAIMISPDFEEALINLGAVYYNISKFEQAYRTLMRCDQNSKNPKLSLYLKRVREKL